MHWAAPRTIGRMISVQKDRMRSSFSVDKESSSSPKNQEEEEEEAESPAEEEENVSDPGSDSDGVDPEDVEYEPKPYASLGFKVPTPPPGVLKTEDEKAREEDEAKRQIFQVTINQGERLLGTNKYTPLLLKKYISLSLHQLIPFLPARMLQKSCS